MKLYIFVAACIAVASAVTEEERNNIKEAARPIIAACGEEFGISKEDILAAKAAKNVDALNPCFYACFMKKVGVLNEDGLFVPEVAEEKNRKYIKGEDDNKNLKEIANTCSSVNDAPVTDGAKGCERSKMLLNCFIQEKANYNFLTS